MTTPHRDDDDGRAAILLVDDTEANLIALEAHLGKLDCTLVRATSGNEALRLLLRHDFAVMLLDVQMPGMDGFEVAHYARDNPVTRDVPIVFITAMHETEENTLRGYGAGAIDILFKPINATILRSKVQIFIELHQERRRLAEEIAAHKRTLAELEAFSMSISHDLRAPLRPLEGFSRILLTDYGAHLDPKARDYLERIRGGAQRMGVLIDDLLLLARMGLAELSRRPIDLAPVAHAVIDELRQAEPGRAVEFTCAPELRVEGDGALLRVVLENLLRNAWKFTARRSPARIELGLDTSGARPTFFVRDNGVGFDPAYAGKLFKPFRRLHTEAESPGAGIGLAIVQRIIRRHGGDVHADAVLGEGATFSFTVGWREPT